MKKEKRPKGTQQKFPPGWDEQRVQKVLAHYENQSEDAALAEDEAAQQTDGQTIIERVATLERQVGVLLAGQAETERAKNWRRTRGAFTGDDLMKQVFEEGRKIREAERKKGRSASEKKRRARP